MYRRQNFQQNVNGPVSWNNVLCSVMSNSVTRQSVALQAPLSMGFSQQEYWSGLPRPPPEDLPDPGIEPVFLHLLYCRWTPPLSNWGSPVRALERLKMPLESPSAFNSSFMYLNNAQTQSVSRC